ncbi:hypothetical protein MAR_004248 [Mya arenaria]|uniref:Uncharacterized protein n=1 Tax=Mya arenaria TaxID=6604 RepID=A0ABY7EW13_MYAAR|nr:hypothetical protein MAR_004248 [Mya arenaria]
MAWIRIVLIAFLLFWILQIFSFSAIDECLQQGYFMCYSSRKCIRPDWVCDGDYDCEGREDEAAGVCSESSLSTVL